MKLFVRNPVIIQINIATVNITRIMIGLDHTALNGDTLKLRGAYWQVAPKVNFAQVLPKCGVEVYIELIIKWCVVAALSR